VYERFAAYRPSAHSRLNAYVFVTQHPGVQTNCRGGSRHRNKLGLQTQKTRDWRRARAELDRRDRRSNALSLFLVENAKLRQKPI
jgi:hypothetical protein